MTEPTYHGTSQFIHVREPGGGEGPGEGDWFWSADCGFVTLEVLDGDTYLIWASAAPSIGGGSTGTGSVATIVPGQVYILNVDGTGEIELDAGDANSFLVHQTAVSISDCT